MDHWISSQVAALIGIVIAILCLGILNHTVRLFQPRLWKVCRCLPYATLLAGIVSLAFAYANFTKFNDLVFFMAGFACIGIATHLNIEIATAEG